MKKDNALTKFMRKYGNVIVIIVLIIGFIKLDLLISLVLVA